MSRPEVGFVEHAQPRLQQRHLQNLIALLLAAGEPDIDPTPQHVLIDIEPGSGVAHALHEFGRQELRLAALFALRIDGGA